MADIASKHVVARTVSVGLYDGEIMLVFQYSGEWVYVPISESDAVKLGLDFLRAKFDMERRRDG